MLAPLLAAAIAAGALGAVGGAYAVRQGRPERENLHDIVHARFDLTADEHRRLDAAEAHYAQRRAAIEGRIEAANARLAAAIRADRQLSPEVLAASSVVEQAAAELQRVTLQHIFEMRAALDPAHRQDYDRVLLDALGRERR